MKSHLPRLRRYFVALLAVVLSLASNAQAGTPLICRMFHIGQAKSLPWSSTAWHLSGNENYDLKNLVRDTLAILDSNAPVLVRMETMRRATLYARKDRQVAKELLTKLHARAASAETAGHPDALASFDFGYLVESYKQGFNTGEPNPAIGVDGYAWVKKAISLRGQDPEMEFAAALITSYLGPREDYQVHMEKAVAGAKGDLLLAQNLGTQTLAKNTTSN